MTAYAEFVNTLSSLTGLHTDVLNAWVAREQGVNNNILGVTSGGSLVKYPSQTAGAIATSNLLHSSSQYAGIINSASGTSAQQALAIAKSPWHLGAAGLAAAGGTDPYYYKGFVQAGILSASGMPSGGVSTPVVPSASALAALQSQLKSIGISTDPTHVFTQAEGLLIANKIYGVSGDIANSIALDWKGKTVLERASMAGTTQTVSAISDAQNSLPNIDVPGALMFVAVVLVGIAFLFLGGIIVLRKPK